MTLYSIRASCPECEAPLRRRMNNTTYEHFLGCSSYPNCRHAEPLVEAEQDLAEQIVLLEAALKRAIHSTPRVREAEPVAVNVDRKLKALLFMFHPDRRGETVPANEIATALNNLRREVTA